MLISRTVATAVKLGYAANRSADGTVALAANGTYQNFPIFSERPDVGTTIAVGLTVTLAVGDIERETYVKLGASVTEFDFLMPTSDGTWIDATTGNYAGCIALQSGVSGDVIAVIPANVYYKT